MAVCCWRDSRSLVQKRTFSIAMTAWAAEMSYQLNLLFGERANFLTADDDRTNQFVLLQHWYCDKRPRTTKLAGEPGLGSAASSAV